MIKQKTGASGALFFPPSEPLRIPWCALLPDNERLTWVYGEARLTPEYRHAKKEAHRLATLWWQAPLIVHPVALSGRLFFPDHRKRDAGNYRKLLTDALTGAVYHDDSLVIAETWELCGYDAAAPRAELTIQSREDATWFYLAKPSAPKPPKLRVFDPRTATAKQLDALKRAMNRRKRPGK